ncbi:MAG: thioesterase family protein [Deltaproteobacteria bacterium]|nr:thioesterase family protein [Deltaproteobacteria bacterium]
MNFKVRFGQVEAAGWLYMPFYFDFISAGIERFFSLYAIPHEQLIKRKMIPYAPVLMECRFHAPARYGDDVELCINVLDVGTKSITMRYNFLLQKEQKLLMSCKMVHVLVNHSGKAIKLPEKIRNTLRKMAQPTPK